jgi:superfamily II DNA or RNA helicase
MPNMIAPDISQEKAAEYSLVLSPKSHLYLEQTSQGADMSPWDPAIVRRLISAFQKGSGHGLFWLGAREVDSMLPPVFARWRDFARVFMHQVCTLSDREGRPEIPFPVEEAKAWLASAPLMTGAEYLSEEALRSLWSEMTSAFHREKEGFAGSLQQFLQRLHPVWNQVGRVYLHLAENKQGQEAPFAFLATYTPQLTHHAQGSRVQHLPLSQALREYSGAKNKAALLSLLRPLQKGSTQSPWLKELVDSGDIYHPMAWTPADAYRLLKDIPVLENAGLIVRVPNWWKAKRPPRPVVRVTLGENRTSKLGMDALLDFRASLTLEGEPLSETEWNRIMQASENLVLVKGKWIEIDREKLKEVLDHWKRVQKSAQNGEISFLEGMRLLAGVPMGKLDAEAGGTSPTAEWSEVVAGSGIAETLQALQSPDSLPPPDAIAGLEAVLRPYQKGGVQWLRLLHRLGLGACLADDMGLGKTVQVLALLLDIKSQQNKGPHLLVLPASLIGNWTSEIQKFAPTLRWLVAHPSVSSPEELSKMNAARLREHDVVITTYGSLLRYPWLAEVPWGLVVLDEAQAIKNPEAKQTKAAKTLKSRHRLALTGTPVENRLSDLWSLFDFLCPGLLGSAPEFSRYAKRLAAEDSPSYGPLRNLVRPYILRRLKSDKKIIADLPDKTEVKAFCGLSKTQAALYQQSVETLQEQIQQVEGIQRRGVILAFLMRFKQICNHPSQWLGDGKFQPADSGKFARLQELAEPIAAKQEKALVFTQFREMTDPLARFLASLFGKPGLILHGETPVAKRKGLVQSFQDDQGPPFFVLSLKAGGTGLNLTAATHVIHFDRWWNPAVENQATDRAYRIGQKKNVLVHKFVCRGTVEERIDELIESKVALSQDLLEGSSEALLTQMSNQELLKTVSLDLNRALADG